MFVEEKEKYFVTTYTSLWLSNHWATRTEKAYIRATGTAQREGLGGL